MDNNPPQHTPTLFPTTNNRMPSYQMRANSFSSPGMYVNQPQNTTSTQYSFVEDNGLPNTNSLSHTYSSYPNTFNTIGNNTSIYETNNNTNVMPNYRENKKFSKIFNTQVKLNLSGKPPYSYCTLLSYAILNSKNQRLTLNEIYSWFVKNYMFFKPSESGWKNSVRHNLSLNKCFIKISRPINEPGKGSYWTINKNFVQNNTNPQQFNNLNQTYYGFNNQFVPRRHSEPLNNQPQNLNGDEYNNYTSHNNSLNTVYECDNNQFYNSYQNDSKHQNNTQHVYDNKLAGPYSSSFI